MIGGALSRVSEYLMFRAAQVPRKVLPSSGIRAHCAHWAEDLIREFSDALRRSLLG